MMIEKKLVCLGISLGLFAGPGFVGLATADDAGDRFSPPEPVQIIRFVGNHRHFFVYAVHDPITCILTRYELKEGRHVEWSPDHSSAAGTAPFAGSEEEKGNIEVLNMNEQITPWRDITTYELTEAEQRAVKMADEVDEVKALRKRYEGDLITGIEIFPDVYRVSYKVGDLFLYAVDVHKVTGKIVYKGSLD